MPDDRAPLLDALGGDERRTPLRGRDDEMAALLASVESLAEGRGGIVLISGEPGAGKTALIDEIAAAADSRQIRVFRGAGDEAGQSIPLAPLLGALVLTDDPPVDATALRELSRHPDQRFWLLRELQEDLERAALEGPLAIMIDDIQWADAASVIALANLPPRLASHRILWVLAVRSDEIARELGATLRRLRENGARTIELAGLGTEAVEEVAADQLGAAPADDLLAVLGRVHGHPFLLVELLRGLVDDGLVDIDGGVARLAGDGIPRRFLDSVAGNLDRLTPRARDAVEMACVLGRRFSVEELADMVGRSPADLTRVLGEARAAGLLIEDGTRLEFRHDLVREAVAALMPAVLRGSLRRRAVDVMVEHGAPAADVATLVLEAARPGEGSSIELLRRAAGEVGRVSPAVAVPLSRRALELTPPDDPERGRRVVETLNFLVHAGQAASADELIEASYGDLVDPFAEAEARLNIGLMMMQYEPQTSVQQCQRALELDGLPGGLRVQLLSLMSRSYELDGDIEGAVEPATRAATEAADSGTPIDQAMSLVPRALISFARGEWREALSFVEEAARLQAESTEPASRLWMSNAWRSLLLVSCCDPEAAMSVIEVGTREAQEEGIEANLRIWSMLRCRALFDRGLLADARAEADVILEMSDEYGGGDSGYLNDVATYVLGAIALQTGDTEELVAARKGAARLESRTSPLARRLGVWLGARLDAAGEDTPGLFRELDPARLDPLATGYVQGSSPLTHEDAVMLVAMLIDSGRQGDAAEVAGRLEAKAAAHPDFPYLRAAAQRARALVDGDADLAGRALALQRDDPRPLARAAAQVDAARLMSEERSVEAVKLLDEALDLYRGAGADRQCARVRRLLRERGVRRPTAGSRSSSEWPELTKSELAVVRLVATGATNREAADRLFVSPYTINSHLRHIFVKLDIRSRVELTRLATERGLVG
jgi:DNA-binding CsgD family transcriptional regulator